MIVESAIAIEREIKKRGKDIITEIKRLWGSSKLNRYNDNSTMYVIYIFDSDLVSYTNLIWLHKLFILIDW